MEKYIDRIKDKYKKNGEKALLVYFTLRILVILCMVLPIGFNSNRKVFDNG